MGTVSTKLSCTECPPEIELALDCLYVALRDLFPFLLLCLGHMSVRKKACIGPNVIGLCQLVVVCVAH